MPMKMVTILALIMQMKNTVGDNAIIALYPSGRPAILANTVDNPAIKRVPTSPIMKKIRNETENILFISFMFPLALFFAIILETATGSPDVDIIKKST